MSANVFDPESIRNIALLSHSGAGKTTLIEAMLFTNGMINRMGSVEEGNTVSDFRPIEIERKSSTTLSLMHIIDNDIKINIIDTPGFSDFIGEVYSAMRVVEGGIIVVSVLDGVEVGTQQSWDYLGEKTKLIFLNKMDRENADFDKVLDDLEEAFGDAIIPFSLPIGAADEFSGIVDILNKTAFEYSKKGDGKGKKINIPEELKDKVNEINVALVERAAESDESLMEKYFEQGELSPEEVRLGLLNGITSGSIIPVFVGSAAQNIGIDILIDGVKSYIPAPSFVGPEMGSRSIDEEPTIERSPNPNEPFSALVFKLISEQHVGDLTYFRVYSGKIKPGDDIQNTIRQTGERMGQLFLSNGKNREEIPETQAGDIVATVKLRNTKIGDTLCEKKTPIVFPAINFPNPLVSESVVAKNKGEEDKIAQGLSRIHDEDPTFFYKVDSELHQTLVYGQGEVHLDNVVTRLKNRFKVEVTLKKPRIPYRETITKSASDRYRHKKQSGGAGEFAEVEMMVEPVERGGGFEYEWKVFGGAISSSFQSSIEKGIKQSIAEGIIAGYPVVDVKAYVVDGKEHPVDSKDVAFQKCGREVFRRAFVKAEPIMLEPIMNLEIIVPGEFTGDIMGDISSRRGRIQGMEPSGKNLQKINVKVPQSELYKYSSTIRSMTQGRGWFSQEFSHYETMPKENADKLIAESQHEKEQ